MLAVSRQVIWRRRVSILWWGLGLLAVDGLLAIAYPTVRGNGELDRTFAGLPPSVQAMLDLQHGSGLTSPIGYLNSQFFANVLPVMLLGATILAHRTASTSITGWPMTGLVWHGLDLPDLLPPGGVADSPEAKV